MIKRIIFDLDNTLIMWKNEYLQALEKTIQKYNLNIEPKYVNDLIDKYDHIYNYYDKNLLIEYINENIEDKIDMNFIEEFLYNIGFCSEYDEKVEKILNYLSNKYELIVLTNWFLEPQKNRIKNAKIDKYFKQIFGAEKYKKPDKESFLEACGNHKPEECIMIGDNYDKDIIGAYNVGLNVIYYNYKKQNNNKFKYKEINELEELKNIL